MGDAGIPEFPTSLGACAVSAGRTATPDMGAAGSIYGQPSWEPGCVPLTQSGGRWESDRHTGSGALGWVSGSRRWEHIKWWEPPTVAAGVLGAHCSSRHSPALTTTAIISVQR